MTEPGTEAPNDSVRAARAEPEAESPQLDKSTKALRTLTGVMLVGLLSIVIYAAQAGGIASFSAIASVGALSAGASALVGGLLGFLFGIPRTLQQSGGDAQRDPNSSSAESDRPRIDYQVNTNLEQISDWLTKILVGVGLTQLPEIRDGITSLSLLAAQGLGNQASNQVFALALICFFLVLGFLFGYLWTRLFFAGALREADAATLGALGLEVRKTKEEVDEIRRQTERDAEALNLVYRQLNPTPDTAKVTQEELDRAIAAARRPIKVQVFNQAWQTRRTNWRNDKPRMELAIPVFRALIKCDEQGVYYLNHGQLGFALKDKAEPDWAAARDELSEAIRIRGEVGGRGWLWFEWNRAACNIALDENFRAKQPSDAQTKAMIVEDLMAAATVPELQEAIEKAFKDWMDLNDIAVADLEAA